MSGTCPWAASTCDETSAPATATCRRCTRARTSWWPRARPAQAADRQRYPHLDDDRGLREQAEFARSLGFFGKSAIHPRQLRTIHDVFTPSAQELTWARAVLDAFAAAGGNAVKLPDGEFVDLPVADRARRLLELACRCPAGAEAIAEASGEHVFG